MEKKLYKSVNDRKIFGVCGGFGEYFGIDPTWIRLGIALFVLAGGAGIPVYLIAALIMKDNPEQ